MQSHILRSLSIDQQLHSRYLKHPTEIDVVISIGGFYGLFMIGTDKILKKLEYSNKLKIQRYSGSSVGAICAVCMACQLSGETLIQMYNRLSQSSNYFQQLRQELLSLLPVDAYLRCSNRVFIHMTQIGFPYLYRHVVVSRFWNNEDLVDAMLASSNMPFIISPHVVYPFRGGYYIDGCFSRFLPIFEDQLHPQLLIKLYKIQYYGPFCYCPKDPSVESLIVKGVVETDKFFSETNPSIRTLSWYSPSISKSNSNDSYCQLLCSFCFFSASFLIVPYLFYHRFPFKKE